MRQRKDLLLQRGRVDGWEKKKRRGTANNVENPRSSLGEPVTKTSPGSPAAEEKSKSSEIYRDIRSPSRFSHRSSSSASTFRGWGNVCVARHYHGSR